jgi:hypothetical protein
MTSEGQLQREIILAASAAGHRLFRVNTAMAWVGEVIRRGGDTLTLKNPRPLRAGLVVGGSDTVGWTRTGRFAAIEVKVRPRRATAEQLAFIHAVQQAGGRACVAYSVAEALDCLNAPDVPVAP